MALQGTIDTFDLTEVIRMLAAGKKTGRLGLSGDRGSGSIWFRDGQVVASETDTSDLAADHVAVLFQLLRFQEGSFVFDKGAESTKGGEERDPGSVVDEATRRLDEWSQIEEIVPSLDHRVELRDQLSRSDVVIDQSCWRALAAVGAGTTVGELGHALAQDELDVSRTVKTLVELGLIEVGDQEPIEDTAMTPPTREGAGTTEPKPGVSLTDSLAADYAAEMSVADPIAFTDEKADLDDVDESVGPDSTEEASPVLAGARDQLDSLASGFGLTDEPFETNPGLTEPALTDLALTEPARTDPALTDPALTDPALADPVLPVLPTVPVDVLDDPLDFGEPLPLAGAVEDGAGSFPIEQAEAAGEARTPLFAHDADSATVPLGTPAPPPQPGDAAEVARQLANLSPEAARAVAAAARATTDEERDAALALVGEDSDEPLDPELLRSFLLSVRQ